jgi:hypothetical protein
MKSLTLILSAAAVCVVASGQAQASWSVVRWNSGFCQPWDSAVPFTPPAGQYKVVSRSYKTMDKAMAKRARLVAKKACM